MDILKIHAKHAEAQDKNAVKIRCQSEMQAFVERSNAMLAAHVSTVNAAADRQSKEMQHVTQIIADFKKEILKQGQGEGSRGTIVVDAASAIAKPVALVMDKMNSSLKSLDETTKALQQTHAEMKKPRKRTARAKRQADGSIVLESEG